MGRNTLRLLYSVSSPLLATEEIKINSAITTFPWSFSPQLYVSSAKGQPFQAWFKMCTHEKRRAKPHKSWRLKIYSFVKWAFLLCWMHTPLLRYGWSVVLGDVCMERADTSDIRGASEGTEILIMLICGTTQENGASIKILRRKAPPKEHDLWGGAGWISPDSGMWGCGEQTCPAALAYRQGLTPMLGLELTSFTETF